MKNNRMLTGLLGLLLCLAMIVGMLPVMASAEASTACPGQCAGHSHANAIEVSENISGSRADWTNNTYILKNSIEVSCNLILSGNVHLCLNGNTITFTGTNNYLWIYSGNTTICDCAGGGKIARKAGVIATTYLVRVNAGGALDMYSGTISGNATTKDQTGAVNVAGTFTLYDGLITGNSAYNGGGVFVNGGTFVMNGGTISGNQCTNRYQAVRVGGGSAQAPARFEMNGGQITGNSGGSSSYGSVGLLDWSECTITGDAVINDDGIWCKTATAENKVTIKELTSGASIKLRAAVIADVIDDTVVAPASFPGAYTYNPASAIVARMVLGNNLDIQFAIPADLAAAGVKINGETATAVGTVTDNGDYNGYSIYEAFVKSNDMTKPFVIEVQKNGKTYTKTESVQAYAERLLGSTNNAEVKTLLVDMLNYGAEAQKYFDKVNTGLANANLTAEQQAAFENVTATNTAGNARLLLENNLDIQIDVGEAYKGKTLKYTFVPFDGAEALTYNATVEEENGVYFITADQVVFADYASVITVMDGNTVVASDSVQNYVGRRIVKGESDVALAKALLKFAISANEYLA